MISINNSSLIELTKKEQIQGYGEYMILQGYIICRAGKHLLKIFKAENFIISEESEHQNLIQYEAQGNVKLAKYPLASATDFLQKQRESQCELMQLIINRLNIYTLPVKERVMVTLYNIACDTGVLKNGDCHIPAIMTQVELSSYAHCTREYLNIVRQTLIREGWLFNGKGFVLQDWQKWQMQCSS
ncbi:Crp/Fnr family transcriptional regulator [Listeria booriae]|uniref:Crp/Fnr family transcriptional regulator n=1 Tax=Listeria booriae TaxID=1552123 RepID=UPI001624CD4C|nr:Crp/Fnr family transcriptional regulator [Listeria booriae]MBC2327806.1 Crp/Fnr family transcriptional regulator [Listeria booriae]